jgi:monovalent cation:proton antiporter-2 (CPA2) family protein
LTAAEALQPPIIYLGAGLAAAFAARAAHISPIIGYLIAGVIIGPSALGAVAQNDTTHFLAELGVAFLLFEIGLHFSLKDIRTRREDILQLATVQIALCGAAFALIGWLLGFRISTAVVVGVSVALSSTAIVVRVLEDRNKPGCPIARSATAVLIAQDIAAIFILTLAASINSKPADMGREVAIALALGLLALGVAIAAGRFLIRPLFRSLAATNNQEAFTAVALFLVIAAAAATERIGLSLTLGAFLAGMAISDSPYRHIIQNEIKPFQGLLLGLFFMSVGMGVNLPSMLQIWPAVVLTAIAIMAVKTGLVFLAARINRWSSPSATQLSFLLSQGSEFTLVVVGIPAVAVSTPGNWSSVLVSAIALTLVVAPLWAALGQHLGRILAERSKADPVAAPEPGEEKPVLIFGMTAEGRTVADALGDHDFHYLAIEPDPERFVSAATDGYDVIYGDARDLTLMDTVKASTARAIVLGATRFVVPQTLVQPGGKVSQGPGRFVAVDTAAERVRYAGLGLRAHLSMAQPKGLELAADILSHLGVEPDAIAAWVAERTGRIADDARAAEQVA